MRISKAQNEAIKDALGPDYDAWVAAEKPTFWNCNVSSTKTHPQDVLAILIGKCDLSKFRLMSYYRKNDLIWQADYVDDSGVGFGESPEEAVVALLNQTVRVKTENQDAPQPKAPQEA